jgi:hypothetical protein
VNYIKNRGTCNSGPYSTFACARGTTSNSGPYSTAIYHSPWRRPLSYKRSVMVCRSQWLFQIYNQTKRGRDLKHFAETTSIQYAYVNGTQ